MPGVSVAGSVSVARMRSNKKGNPQAEAVGAGPTEVRLASR